MLIIEEALNRLQTLKFQDGFRLKLQHIEWWNWPVDKIQKFLPHIMNGEVDSLADSYQAQNL